MIRLINKDEHHLFEQDPVRPHLPIWLRTEAPNETYIYSEDGKTVDAVICVAYCDKVPLTETELYDHGTLNAIFYTVWSYTKGCGTKIIFDVKKHIESTKPRVERFVTLSPITDMATKFHFKNGAERISIRKDCGTQNFEYV